MGLNMSVTHVAFHSLSKFDGRHSRALRVSELAQIAGRAGRHLNDGSFGALAPCAPLPDDVAHAIENHQFEPDRHAVWRNHDLDTSNLDALLDSLHAAPPRSGLRPLAGADDSNALQSLAERPWLRRAANCPERVELLWQVCQVPDYRKLLPEEHVELLGSIYAQLSGPSGALGGSWLSERIERLDDDQGDIDTLLSRLAFTRTWTYVSHQTRWLERAKHWQQRTRDIEERLSDALHERLMQRFVERRRGHASGGTARPRNELADPLAGQAFAGLMALRAKLGSAEPSARLGVHELVDAAHDQFRVDARGVIHARGVAVGQLRKGTSVLHPEVSVASEFEGGDALRLERRLRAFTKDALLALLTPVAEEGAASAPERGLLYQLRSGLGVCTRAALEDQLKGLNAAERAGLQRRGIHVGVRFVYCPDLVHGDAMHMRAALLAVYHGRNFGRLAEGPASESTPSNLCDADLRGLGYERAGTTLLRCDVFEAALTARQRGVDAATLAETVGCTEAEVLHLLSLLPRSSKRRRRRKKRHPNAQQTSGQSGSAL
jgi:ATP-dependent RNA helicase SUPV3L1/SUV3